MCSFVCSAKFYDGKTVTICSKVQSTFTSQGEKKNTYLNFGQPFPDATFIAVIFEKDLPNFKYVPADFLKDKKLCITGKVSIYKDKPQIIVSSEDQIKVE